MMSHPLDFTLALPLVAGCFSMAGTTQCDTTSTDGTSDNLGLLVRQRQLQVLGKLRWKPTYDDGLVV
jgi:hypothetical protein